MQDRVSFTFDLLSEVRAWLCYLPASSMLWEIYLLILVKKKGWVHVPFLCCAYLTVLHLMEMLRYKMKRLRNKGSWCNAVSVCCLAFLLRCKWIFTVVNPFLKSFTLQLWSTSISASFNEFFIGFFPLDSSHLTTPWSNSLDILSGYDIHNLISN